MIYNYIFLLDFFGIFICGILLINIYVNRKNYNIENNNNQFVKLIIINIMIGILSILYNFSIIYNISYIITKFIYLIYSIASITEITFMCQILIESNNLEKKTLIKIKKFFDFLFLTFILISSIFIITKKNYLISPDFSKNLKFIDIFNLIYVYVTIMFGISLHIIKINKNNIMSSIYKNLTSMFPMGIALILLDFNLKLKNTKYSWSISCGAFSFFLIAIFILYHFRPYNKKFGTMGQDAFDEFLDKSIINNNIKVIIKIIIENKKEFILEYNEKKYEKYIHDILIFLDKYDFNVYKIRDDIYLAYDGQIDSEFTSNFLNNIIKYMKSHINIVYKMIVTELNDNITSYFDFYNLIDLAFKKSDYNNLYICNEEDYKTLIKENIIKSELLNIVKKKDYLNDEKIIVTAQPIYDIKTGKYKTAEALVRFKSDTLGIVFPDQFIYLAEEIKIIHKITLIVLNKVCKEISNLLKNNIYFEGITVNVSAEEFLIDSFVSDIINIIKNNNIPYYYIRLEFTESLFAENFDKIKVKMNQLIKYGIIFYLDDFGTGYSNFDKIISLPLTTIKFDKSLVWGATKDDKKYFFIKELTEIFIKSGFLILYEGIEDKKFEDMAIDLSVNSLQGYKYSKPIPLQEIGTFFSK